ncbi:hypothetical protein BX666DRAFT_2009280 [Dichotomocladium elegans]|nr:hypothetical protein BX666DRAFT_2009280 [Dichotomocladium elegans]
MRKFFGIRKKRQASSSEVTTNSKGSLSSVITNNSNQPAVVQKASQRPVRSLDDNSNSLELMMPKPRHAVPPTRAVLESHDRDKTLVDPESPSPVLPVPRQQEPRCVPGHHEHPYKCIPATKTSHETANYRNDPALEELSPQPAGSEDSFWIYETAFESPFSSSSVSLCPSSSKTLQSIVPVPSLSEPTISKTASTATFGRQRSRRAVPHFPPLAVSADRTMSEHYYCPLPTEPAASSTMNATSPDHNDQQEIDALLAAAAARMMLSPLPPPTETSHTHDPNVQALQYHVAVIKQQCEIERIEYEKREREHRARERDMLKKISEAQQKLEYTLLMQQEERNAIAAATSTRTTTPRPRSANDSGYWDRNGASECGYMDDTDAYDADEERYAERRWPPRGRSTSVSKSSTRRGRSAPRIHSRPPSIRRPRSWWYLEDGEMAQEDEYGGLYFPEDYQAYPELEELDSAYHQRYSHRHRRPPSRRNAQPKQPKPREQLHQLPRRPYRGTFLHPSEFVYYRRPHPRYPIAPPWE